MSSGPRGAFARVDTRRIGTLVRRRHVALSALVWVVSACSSANATRPARTHLTAADAVRIANFAADKAHMHRYHYGKPSAVLDPDGTTWHVYYDGPSELTDDCFSVDVYDRTGKPVVYICA